MDASRSQTEKLQESWGEGVHRVEASALICGKDIVVVIEGGTRYHIGAVALAVPRPSLADPERISASASVLCVTGHKEDDLARMISLQIASALNCAVTVIAGIHIDDAKATDLSKMTDNCTKAISNLVERLKSR
ncbi:hypothetical protein [Anaerospora sp.]|jgi:hypothetical protein|uniref:prenylated flavin chaperone LpdD n=1 Tax=Anaerospora sp. TaxID=1960278 RepID=UPI0028A20CD4|nr:hypothetical protein [Anaerospora sp.]